MPPGRAARAGASGACNLRERHDLPLDAPIPDLLALVEDDCGVPVGVLPRLGADLAGGYFRRGERRLILLNADDVAPRMRFTLAHELGHHYFHHLERVPELAGAPSIADTRAELSGHAHDWWEVQANAFAAELLIPAPAVERWHRDRGRPAIDLPGVADLACRFGTSLLMTAYRLHSAALLTRDAALEDLKARIEAGEGDGLVARHPPWEDGIARARASAPRVPPGLERSSFAALASGRRTAQEAAQAIGRDPAAVARTVGELGLVPPA